MKVKLLLLKDHNLHPKRYKKGDIVEIPDKIAERWIAKKIAIEIKNNKKRRR